MNSNELTITINSDTKGVQAAEKELGHLEKSVYSVKKAVTESTGSWTKYSSAITACSTSFMAVKTAVEQYVIAPLASAVQSFMALGDQISKTSQRVGMSTETLGGLKFAAEQCGANFDILTAGIQKFQNTLGAVQMGDAGAIGKLSKLGLSADAFAGLSNEDQLMKVADYIKSIGDKAEQTRVAMELFGKSGFKLLPFFQEGSEGIRKLIEEGKDIGAVMGEEATEDAVKMTDAMNRMKTSAAGISNVLISSLAPSITAVLDGATQLAKSTSKFIKDYGPLVHGIGSAVAAFVLLKGVMLSTTTVIPALVAGFNALKVAIMANPYLLAGAAIIGGLVAAWSLWNKSIQDTNEKLYKLSDSARKYREEMEKAQAADQGMLDRLNELSELAEKDTLNNAEVEEATRLIAALTAKYGDLGLSIDETTGKITGMAEAQKKMLEQQTEDKIRALQLQIDEENANLDRLERKYTKGKKLSVVGKISEWMTGESLTDDEKAEYERDRDLIFSRLGELKRQKFRLLHQDDEDVEGDENEFSGMTDQEVSAEARARRESSNADRSAYEEDFNTRNAKRQKDIQAAYDFGKDPFTLRLEKLDRDFNEKLANIKAMQQGALRVGDMDTWKLLSGDEDTLTNHWKKEREKVIKEQRAEAAKRQADEEKTQQEEKQKKDDQEKELRRLMPGQTDEQLSAAEAAVQAARNNQAEAILSGGDVAKADEELKAAKLNLQKEVARASGKARQQAKAEWLDAQETYNRGVRDHLSNEDLIELAKAVTEAKEKWKTENDAYFAAVGALRNGQGQPVEDAIQDVIQTTLSSSGTFSAYGLDAVATSDIPKQTLDVLKKLLDNTDEIKKEQKNNAAYTEE